MKVSEVPFERSYWVVPDRLLAGYYPGDRDDEVARRKLRGLIDCGITYLVNLMELTELDHDGHPFVPYAELLQRLGRERGIDVRIDRVPIPDGTVPSIELMREIIHRLELAIGSGCRVYVHCWGGVGRTGLVVGCFLISNGLSKGETALARLKELRHSDPTASRPSPETAAQQDFVRAWADHLSRANAASHDPSG